MASSDGKYASTVRVGEKGQIVIPKPARELFGNPGWGGDSWVARHPVLMAVVWPLALTVVFFILSVRAYQRLDR